MKIDYKAEAFACTVYGRIQPELEDMLDDKEVITKTLIARFVRVALSGTEYESDARMIEYIMDTLASSYIG